METNLGDLDSKTPFVKKRFLGIFQRKTAEPKTVQTEESQKKDTQLIPPVELKPVPPVEPKIFVAKSVVEKLIRETGKHPLTETGEALVGIMIPPNSPDVKEPTIYVLGTIPPDDSAIRRNAYFSLGDTGQEAVFRWLSDNWDEMRKLSQEQKVPTSEKLQIIPLGVVPSNFDYPLKHLGDWHKHPGEMYRPSGGDFHTAMELVFEDNNMDEILIPVTTYRKEEGFHCDPEKLICWENSTEKVSITFSYLSRRMLDRGEHAFLHIHPTIVDDACLPKLPPISWHFENRQRFLQEISLLQGDGCEVRVLVREMTGAPPMEVCFAVQKQGWNNRILFVTDVNYPQVAPEVRILPKSSADKPPKPKKSDGLSVWFKNVWAKARRIFVEEEPPLERFLIHYVWQLEEEGKL